MIVITQSLVLDPVETGPDHPLIGWRNVVTAANVAADSAATSYPVSNLANPATNREWRAAAAVECHLTITTDGVTPLDYLAVARHNFGSGLIRASVEGYLGSVWTELTSPVYLPDDTPALFRFSRQAMTSLRLRLQASAIGAVPRAAVMYAGKLLVMERRLYVGHTPLPHGRKANVTNGMSESGQFLGRIQLTAWRESMAPFRLISPAWYRENMDAFLDAAQRLPFFFAWRPGSYPREVGYAVLTDNVLPVPEGSESGNLYAFSLPMRGVA